MKHLDLFSGIGGFSLACEWAGIETIGFVEIDKYCQKVLRKHWPGVPIVEDIRDVEQIKQVVKNAIGSNGRSENRDTANEGRLGSKAGRKGIQANSEGRTGVAIADNQPTDIDGQAETIKSESPAILITAGFPCQPFSVAGKQQGEGDDRYLWPETLAVIEAVKPSWVLLENVTGIINLALDTVLSDLEGEGYATETLVIPACAVNAWHRRDRVWIVAHCNGNGEGKRYRGNPIGGIPRTLCQWRNSEDTKDAGPDPSNGSLIVAFPQGRESREQAEPEGREDSGRGSQEVAMADTADRLPQSRGSQCDVWGFQSQILRPSGNTDNWAVEPELGRVAHGIPHRVDRLKCLGNAIVPQVAYEIIKAIRQIDSEML